MTPNQERQNYMGQMSSGITRTMSFTSGKGGVGKSTLTVNTGLQLAREGARVLLLDGDMAMANLDIMLGVRPTHNLSHVIAGTKNVEDVLVEIEKNLTLLPGGSGVRELQNLSDMNRRLILDQLEVLPQTFDYVLVDTAPGIDSNVLSLNAAVGEINVILTPDPSSLTDAYALIKVLNRDLKVERFNVLCNLVRDDEEGLAQFKRLSDVANQFLFVSLDYLGSIPMDPYLRQSTRAQQILLKTYDQAPSAKAVKNLVKKLRTTNHDEYLRGGVQAFWSQLVGLAC